MMKQHPSSSTPCLPLWRRFIPIEAALQDRLNPLTLRFKDAEVESEYCGFVQARSFVPRLVLSLSVTAACIVFILYDWVGQESEVFTKLLAVRAGEVALGLIFLVLTLLARFTHALDTRFWVLRAASVILFVCNVGLFVLWDIVTGDQALGFGVLLNIYVSTAPALISGMMMFTDSVICVIISVVLFDSIMPWQSFVMTSVLLTDNVVWATTLLAGLSGAFIAEIDMRRHFLVLADICALQRQQPKSQQNELLLLLVASGEEPFVIMDVEPDPNAAAAAATQQQAAIGAGVAATELVQLEQSLRKKNFPQHKGTRTFKDKKLETEFQRLRNSLSLQSSRVMALGTALFCFLILIQDFLFTSVGTKLLGVRIALAGVCLVFLLSTLPRPAVNVLHILTTVYLLASAALTILVILLVGAKTDIFTHRPYSSAMLRFEILAFGGLRIPALVALCSILGTVIAYDVLLFVLQWDTAILLGDALFTAAVLVIGLVYGLYRENLLRVAFAASCRRRALAPPPPTTTTTQTTPALASPPLLLLQASSASPTPTQI